MADNNPSHCPDGRRGGHQPSSRSDDSVAASIHVSSLGRNTMGYYSIEEDRSIHEYTAEYCERMRCGFKETLPRSLMIDKSHLPIDEVVIPGRGSHGPKVEVVETSMTCDARRAMFDPEEISLGPKLGEGNFSNVYEIKSFRLREGTSAEKENKKKCWSAEESANRLDMKGMEKYRGTENSRYALKHIKDGFLQERGWEEYVQAATDLAIEAEFLSILSHPNIVRLRGLPCEGVDGFANGPRGYFLIIDRLFETLDQRIERWHHQPHGQSTTTSSVKGMVRAKMTKVMRSLSSEFKSTKTTANEGGIMLQDECLYVGLQISAALAYLHQHSIIFRDLKPDNVGFDVRGDVKIFDFGLARFVPKDGDPHKDLFEMSGAGSPRYMAPELLNGKDYNLKADVYTFSIVLWEILTGQKPYSFVKSRGQLTQHVVEEHGRPDIDPSWPSPIQHMLEDSFEADIDKRPRMDFFFEIIRHVLISLRGSSDGLSDTFINHRRTAVSFGQFNTNLVASLKNTSIKFQFT